VKGEKAIRAAREAAQVVASGTALPYAALVVSSMVMGFELFRG
jgi:hypothetical protein